MVLSTLSAYQDLRLKPGIPTLHDHHLFTNRSPAPISLSKQYVGLGIITVLEGKAEIEVNENKFSIDSTNFSIVNEGSRLSVETLGNTYLVLLFFKSISIDLVCAELLFRNPGLPNSLDELKDKTLIEHVHFTNASIASQLKHLISVGNSCASFQALKADALLKALLTDISQQNVEAIGASKRIKVIKKSTLVSMYQRLILTKSWMDRNFSEKIDLGQSARIAMMNEAHFLRNFKMAFGFTPHQYLMHLRLKESKRLLRLTDKTMIEISEHIGFETPSSFSYQFGKIEGVSPSDYRKKSKTIHK